MANVVTNSKLIKKGSIFTIQLTDEQIAALKFNDGAEFYDSKRPVIKSPDQAYKFVKHLSLLKREHFILITLSVRNRAIGKHAISSGTLDATIVHPREVFRTAIMDNAAKVIVVHNHPSGDPTPSDDDLVVTKRLVTAGKILGISVIDHLIVAGNSTYSIQEHGQM